MTKRKTELIEFLEESFGKLDDSKLWIIKDICKHNGIRMTSEWNREKHCPVFKPIEYKGSAKDIVTNMMMNGEWGKENDGMRM